MTKIRIKVQTIHMADLGPWNKEIAYDTRFRCNSMYFLAAWDQVSRIKDMVIRYE